MTRRGLLSRAACYRRARCPGLPAPGPAAAGAVLAAGRIEHPPVEKLTVFGPRQPDPRRSGHARWAATGGRDDATGNPRGGPPGPGHAGILATVTYDVANTATAACRTREGGSPPATSPPESTPTGPVGLHTDARACGRMWLSDRASPTALVRFEKPHRLIL
jgi:hypothetical protein